MRALFIGVITATSVRTLGRAEDPTRAEVFEERIVSIFMSPNPSSCFRRPLVGVEI